MPAAGTLLSGAACDMPRPGNVLGAKYGAWLIENILTISFLLPVVTSLYGGKLTLRSWPPSSLFLRILRLQKVQGSLWYPSACVGVSWLVKAPITMLFEACMKMVGYWVWRKYTHITIESAAVIAKP